MINCEVVVASELTDVTAAIIRDAAELVADAVVAILVVFDTIVVSGKFGCVVEAFGLIAKMAVVASFLVVIAIGSELGIVTVLIRAWVGAVVIHIDVETVLAPCEIVSVVDTAGETLAMDVAASVFGFVIVILFNMVESALPVVTAAVEGGISVIPVVCFVTLVEIVSVLVFATVGAVGDCESVLGASEVTPIILVVIFVASAILVSVVAIMDEVPVPFVVEAEVSETAALVVGMSALGTVIVVTFSLLVLLISMILVSIVTVVIPGGAVFVSILIAVDAISVIIAFTDVVVTTAAAAVLDRVTVVIGTIAGPAVVAGFDGIVVVVAGTVPGEDATTVELCSETDKRKAQHDEDWHTEGILRT